MSEYDAEVEARKQAGLEKLLAKGWRREELTWSPPVKEPMPPKPETPPREMRVHEYDEEAHEYKTRIEMMSPERAARVQEKRRAFEEKRRLGMWTINGEALSRRNRESAMEIWSTATGALAFRCPDEAAAVHAAFVNYYDAPFAGQTSRTEQKEKFWRFVDGVVLKLPEHAADILRLAKAAYTMTPAEGNKEKLFAACAAMREGRTE